ncbi:MAG: kazal domain protein [Desulfocapsaceae bacterium]
MLILSGCNSDDGGSVSGSGDSGITKCPSDRPPPPVACTLEYDPVCGFQPDGSSLTYSNGCSACADLKVVSYLKGSCP